MKIRLTALAAIVAACASVAIAQPAMNPGANVDGTAIVNADKTPGEWLSNGRTYSEQRFSPLASINTSRPLTGRRFPTKSAIGPARDSPRRCRAC